MAATIQEVRKLRLFGRLSPRERKKTRFWNWERWRSTETQHKIAPTAALEESRLALADWLRMAHSILDNKTLDTPSLQSHVRTSTEV